jgi:hypothetical protein
MLKIEKMKSIKQIIELIFPGNKQLKFLEDWDQKRDLILEEKYGKDRYNLRVSGFASRRMLWLKKEDKKSFFEITLPGCAMGSDCSTCLRRKEEFKSQFPFRIFLADRDNWVAEIDALPESDTDESISKFLGFKVSVLN